MSDLKNQTSAEHLVSAVHQYKHRIDRVLAAEIERADIKDVKLKDAMAYSLLLGGKRVRPFLVYATGALFGASDKDLDIVAAAIEAIHTYSLIHDDLPAMDDDDLRRGKATCHKKFDEATAILAGDTLQSFAFNLLATHKFENVNASQVVKLIATLTSAANKMCAGQSIDLQQTNADGSYSDRESALIELANMHKLKTGALIEAAVSLGAICGKANDKEMAQLSQYASAIGLAFQVWDDVLDIVSDTETLGKPQGSDLDANKTTYPALMGLAAAKDKAFKLVDQANNALIELPYNTKLLSQLAHYIVERDH